MCVFRAVQALGPGTIELGLFVVLWLFNSGCKVEFA